MNDPYIVVLIFAYHIDDLNPVDNRIYYGNAVNPLVIGRICTY